MTKTKALVLTFVVIYSLVVVAWMALAVAGASEEVFVAVILPIGCAGAFAASEVVAHYAPPDDRRR